MGPHLWAGGGWDGGAGLLSTMLQTAQRRWDGSITVVRERGGEETMMTVADRGVDGVGGGDGDGSPFMGGWMVMVELDSLRHCCRLHYNR